MKRVLWCFYILIICLTGCQNSEDIDQAIPETKHSEDIDDSQRSYVLTQLYDYKYDEETDKIKYAPFFGEDIIYEGEELSVYASIGIDTGRTESTKTQVLLMLMVDGQLIPFSVDSGKKTYIHHVWLENMDLKYILLLFHPEGMKKETTSTLTFVVIPFYDLKEMKIDQNNYVYINQSMYSSIDTDGKSYGEGKDYDIAPVETVYNKSIAEISSDNGILKDYLIFHENKLRYLGDYSNNGTYITYLFCDGELLEGFYNDFYLRWNKSGEGCIHKEIDIRSLNKEEHTLFSVTFQLDENECVISMEKSLNFYFKEE